MQTIAEQLAALPVHDAYGDFYKARLSLYQRAVREYLEANDAMDKYVDFDTRPWAEFLADERRAFVNLRLVAKEAL